MRTTAILNQPRWLPWAVLSTVLLIPVGFSILMNGPQKYTVAAAIAIGIGTGAVYTSLRYLRLRETMHFTPEGIEPHTGGLIPWDDIEEMTVTSKGGQHLLEVSLTDPARYYGSHDLGDSAPLRWKVSNAKYGQQAVEDAAKYRAALPE